MSQNKPGFFAPDGAFIRIGGLICDFLLISLFWMVFSGVAVFFILSVAFGEAGIPWILALIGFLNIAANIGPATTAALYVMGRRNREVLTHMFREYWDSWKENYKQAVGLSIGLTLVIGALAYGLFLILNNFLVFGTLQAAIIIGLEFMFLILIVFVYLYSFALLARFEMRTFDYVRMAFLMSVKHLPMTLLCLVILAAAVAGCYFIPPCFLLLPGISLYLRAALLERVFKNYMEEEDEVEEDEEIETDYDLDAERQAIIDRYMGKSHDYSGEEATVTIVKEDEKEE